MDGGMLAANRGHRTEKLPQTAAWAAPASYCPATFET
jgi:hypothetical protein